MIGFARRRRTPSSHGQALVEFALVAPFLFLLVIGVFEAARLVFYFHMLNHADREGARYAIVHGENAFDGCPSGPVPFGGDACDTDADNIKQRIRDSSAGLDASAIAFGWPGDGGTFPVYWAYTDSCQQDPDDPAGASDTMPSCSTLANNSRHNNVTVRIEYAYSPIILSEIFGTITLRAETTLVINN